MQVFAHRGNSAHFPENSRSAICAAKSIEVTGVELDIFQVGDEFIVFHDRWLRRILGVDKRVVDLTPDELKQLKGLDGLPLPTLDWVIEEFSECDLQLNIEIKQVDSIRYFYEALMNSCKHHGFALDRLLISSFNHTYLAFISKQTEYIRLGLLMATHPVELAPCLPDFDFYSIHLDMDCISSELIRQVKSLNYKVFVFTVDDDNEVNWLLNNKVDAIFANNPVQAHKIINNLE